MVPGRGPTVRIGKKLGLKKPVSKVKLLGGRGDDPKTPGNSKAPSVVRANGINNGDLSGGFEGIEKRAENSKKFWIPKKSLGGGRVGGSASRKEGFQNLLVLKKKTGGGGAVGGNGEATGCAGEPQRGQNERCKPKAYRSV